MATPFRTRLYRRAGWVVISLGLPLLASPFTAGQFARKSAQSQGPRALGLLEIFPSGQARLRPICIMVNGRFYDASVYKADPVPMALDTGVVYEAERAGESQGLFTIKKVLQNNVRKTFLAEGVWLPAGAETPKTGAMKAEIKLKQEDEDKPPVLRRPGSEPPKTEPKPPAAPPSTPSKPTPDEDSDRPVLRKPESPANAETKASAQTAVGSAADENDPNRPRLRRETPGAPPSSPATQPPKTAAKHPATAASAKSQTQFLPAISDAAGPEPRPYTYDATPKELDEFRAKVLALASQELVSKTKELEPEPVNEKPRPVRAQKANPKPVPAAPVWDDVQLRVFDVSTSNEPILALSAKGRLPQPDKRAPSPEFYVTVVAHSDLYGELRSLFSAVTEDRTLDITPKYQLIDVVDADGDGRGELLFRRTSDQGTSYVVYRVGADRLWPLYEGTPSGS